MRSPLLACVIAVLVFVAVRILVTAPGSYRETFFQPFRMLFGSGSTPQSQTLELSEAPDSIRAAGRRLLQPFGVVRVVRIYDTPEPDVKTEKTLP